MSSNGISNIDVETFFSKDDLKKTIWEYTHKITLQDI